MKKIVFLLSLIVALMFLSATPARAVLNRNDTGGCDGTIDQCFHAGYWWYTVYNDPGSVWSPEVQCGLAAGCQTCADNAFGKQVCAYNIRFSASCSCQDLPVPGSGPGITYCNNGGSCTYRSN